MTGSVEPIAPGSEVVPGYEVLDHLSRTRLFDVYDVWSAERTCRCIVKTIRDDRRDVPGVGRRLESEARLLARLSHPHIVRGYGFVRVTRPAAILETLGGATLAHLLDDAGALRPVEAAMLGLHLCSAAGYLHAQRYVHLDLKPSNIVADGGRAKVIDLSVARRPGRARPGVGTWCYMAPEQARGGLVGHPADVWGIGVVLFEAVTGEPAFGGDDPAASRSTSEEAPDHYPQLEAPAPSLPTRVPRPLRRAIADCLAAVPSRRPTVPELAARLETVPGTPSLRALRPSS